MNHLQVWPWRTSWRALGEAGWDRGLDRNGTRSWGDFPSACGPLGFTSQRPFTPPISPKVLPLQWVRTTGSPSSLNVERVFLNTS